MKLKHSITMQRHHAQHCKWNSDGPVLYLFVNVKKRQWWRIVFNKPHLRWNGHNTRYSEVEQTATCFLLAHEHFPTKVSNMTSYANRAAYYNVSRWRQYECQFTGTTLFKRYYFLKSQNNEQTTFVTRLHIRTAYLIDIALSKTSSHRNKLFTFCLPRK